MKPKSSATESSSSTRAKSSRKAAQTNSSKKHVGEEVLELDYDEKLMPTLKEAFPDAQIERLGDRMQIFTNKPHGVFEGFLKEHPLQNVTIRNANLEDVFLKLTGRGLREE